MPPDDIETDETSTSTSVPDELNPDASPIEEGSEGTLAPEEDDSPDAVAARELADRKAARLKAAEAAEKRDAALRAKRTRDRELQEREERLRAREAQLSQHDQMMQAQRADIEARKAAILRGGPDALKAIGIEYGEWTKSYLEETSPDNVAQRALKRAEEVEAELKRRDEADARRKAAENQEQIARRFEAFADENADEYPAAADLAPRVFRQLADEAAHEYIREFGSPPSYAALLPRLDRKAKALQDEKTARTAKQRRSGTQPSDGATNTQASPSGPASTPANRTLTPALAGTRATPAREMTDEEKDKWAAAELRRALAEDRKAERLA